MREFIKKFLPVFLINAIRRYKYRDLANEINRLDVESMGYDEYGPWVKLVRGYKFYGLDNTDSENEIYSLIESRIDLKDYRCFGVLKEILDRYIAPRSLPGELLYQKTRYYKDRDPLNDLILTDEERNNLANVFKLNLGDTVVDIGAYHGFGTLRLAHEVGKKGRVIAFEADPESVSLIKLNLKCNSISNVILIPKAASNYTKTNADFFYDGIRTGNSLRGDVLEGLGITTMDKISIDVVKPDDVLETLGVKQVDHINITVNGAEPEVLEGLERTIRISTGLRITMPGWYYRDGYRLDELLVKKLLEIGVANVKSGKLGRVVAWK